MTLDLDRNLQALGLDEIIEALVARAATLGGKQMCASLRPARQIDAARLLLEETDAAMLLVIRRPDFVIEPCEDITSSLVAAEKKSSLRGTQFRALIPVLHTGEAAVAAMESMQEDQEKLSLVIGKIPRATGLAEMIEDSIEEDGAVKTSATPAIERLFHSVNSLRKSIRERAEKYLSDPAVSALLQDSYVTLRDSRFVLPVRAEEKSRMDGIIHGSSNSGQTYFIEPKALVDLNNRLRTAEIELEEEINRFLAELTGMVAAEAETIRAIYAAVCKLDSIMARARLSAQLGLTKPALGGALNLVSAANPVMLLEGKNVVSNSVTMPAGARALVISGPNTGGKTVLLKLIGLCSVMGAMGLFIPAAEGSSVPFHTDVFADIGDSQSIAEDLSSFSGHILAIRRILEKAGPGKLALLDELMINTDPKEGSALALATMEELVARGADVVVTTHYHELKLLAQTNPEYANLSMDFDREKAKPTYRVVAGTAGESSAISVAENLSLDSSIITCARSYLAGSDERTEKLLAELRETKEKMDQDQMETARSLLQASQAQAQAEKYFQEAENLRDEARKASKMKIANDVRSARGEIAQLLEEARRASGSREKLVDASKKLGALETQVAQAAVPEARISSDKLGPGDTAYVIPLQQKGVVAAAPSGGKLEVMVGKMSVTVGVDEVVGVGSGPVGKQPKASWADIGPSETVEEGEPVEINIRGMRAEPALEEVEKRLDEAYGSKTRIVRIIHGKGTGALRQAVREYLITSPYVKDFRLGEPREGGEGATVVILR